MNDEKKRFATSIKRLIDDANESRYRAPISGNAGEDCLGYITDPEGRLFRLQKQYKTDADIGPGSYTPQLSKAKGRTIGVRNPEIDKKRTFSNRPAFYSYEEKRTKILHYIPGIVQEDILHKKRKKTEMEEEEEDNDEPQKERKANPKVLHPCFNLKTRPKKEKTEDEEKKEEKLLKKKEKEMKKREIMKYFPTEDEYERNPTAQWANQTGRNFPEAKPSEVPDPCAYTLPDTIGRGNGYKFRPRVKQARKTLSDITPSPNEYDPKIPEKGYIESLPNKTKPKDFTLSAPKNLKKPDPEPPGPCEFQKYESPLIETRPRSIMSRHSLNHENWQNISEQIPGPGNYDLQTSLVKPRASSSVEPRKPISQTSGRFGDPIPTFF